MEFNTLAYHDWNLSARNYHIQSWWHGYLLLKNGRCILALEKDPHSSRITADLLGPLIIHNFGFKLYYGYMNNAGRVRGVYRWTRQNRIKTVCV